MNRGFEPLLLLRNRLSLLGIVPQCRILHARIELVEPPQRLLPVERSSHQRQCGVDPVDMGLPFGTHRNFSNSLANRLVGALRRCVALYLGGGVQSASQSVSTPLGALPMRRP